MGTNVLAVDDSAAIRKVIRHCLEILDKAPDEFFQAANGEDGLLVLEQHPVDILFLDLNMPGMNGFQMIERIRQRPQWSSLKVVVVSSETSKTRIQELEKQNIFFIHKPFTPEDMEVVLDKMGQAPPASQLNPETMQAVMREVFNIMTFSPMEILEPEHPPEGTVMRSQMIFSGPLSGRMTLRLPTAILPDLARNMFGEDSTYTVTEQEQRDVIGELLNVIAGNLLNVQAGLEKTFDLGIPSTGLEAPGDVAEYSQASDHFRLWFTTGWAELVVAVR